MEAEIDAYQGYQKNSHSENPNSRNVYKEKLVHSRYVNMEIPISQDRDSSFQPKVVPKRKKGLLSLKQQVR